MPVLKRLSKDIEAAFVAASYKAGQAKQTGHDAIKEAILCGSLLTQAKTMVPPRRWSYWLSQCCPKLSRATAYRWMHLARESKTKTLENCAGMRQAYITCGILPEPEPSNGSSQIALTPDSLLRSLSCIRRHSIGRETVLAWPADEQRRFLDALRACVALYRELEPDGPPPKESL